MKITNITRREVVKTAGKALATLGCMAASPSVLDASAIAPPAQTIPASPAIQGTNSTDEKLTVATCQFPVGAVPAENAKYIREYMRQAAARGAHLLHTSECSLSGYGGVDFPTFKNYDWNALRKETTSIRALAKELNLWLAMGSSHYLDRTSKPTNCVYLIDPEGAIVNRYDKSFLGCGEMENFSAGNRRVTHDIRGVRIGLAICYDICWPQLYIAYRDLGVTVMLHSMYNAGGKGKSCLDTLNVRQVPTRCADNHMWAVVNNSSKPYSHWGSFIARPDATIPAQLEMNRPGMLIHDFPDVGSVSGGCALEHDYMSMKMSDDTIMHWGLPSNSPRQSNGQSEP